MKEPSLLTVWGNINQIWHRLLQGLWVTLGIEITCLVLLVANIIPFWGWLVSCIPWGILVAINVGIDICTRQIMKEYEEAK